MAHRFLFQRGNKTASIVSLPAIVIAANFAIYANPATAAEPSTAAVGLRPVSGGAPSATGATRVDRPHDQMWLVSCRSVSHDRHDDDLDELTYAVHQPTTGWTATNQQAFVSGAPATTTCVLVLGNGYTASETRSLGQTAYRRLTAGLPADLGVRFVIWSWPSDHTDLGPIKDLRIKAARTPGVAYCLARWLDNVPSPERVSLLGTSFGARIVMEALELRAGGQVGNWRLEPSSGLPRPKVGVVLISAAIDNGWLLPGRRLGDSLSQTDRLLLVNNSSDYMLKRYHWLYGPRSKVGAVGSTGLPTGGLSAAGDISQIDAAPIIGRYHGCGPYFESPRLVTAMRSCLFPNGDASPQVPSEGIAIPIAAKPDRNVRQE